MQQRTRTQIDMHVTCIYNHMQLLSSLMNDVPASEADDINSIISVQYPFIEDLESLCVNVQIWKEDVQRRLRILNAPVNFNLYVDGVDSTLHSLLIDNTAPDVEQITEEDIKAVKALQPGQSVYIGTVEVKRSIF